MTDRPPDEESSKAEEASRAEEPKSDQPAPLDSAIPIPEEFVEIVREAGEDPTKVPMVLQMAMSYWRGPLPPPEQLAAYNDAFPGCAERLVGMAESQANHRQSLESTVVNADVRLRQRGQYCGFIIAMTVIVGGFVLIGLNKSLYGVSAIIVALAGLVGLFLYSRSQADDALAEKRAALDQAIAGSGQAQLPPPSK